MLEQEEEELDHLEDRVRGNELRNKTIQALEAAANTAENPGDDGDNPPSPSVGSAPADEFFKDDGANFVSDEHSPARSGGPSFNPFSCAKS